jgi:hypothetical protein
MVQLLNPGSGTGFFSSPYHSDWLWGPLNLLFIGYWGSSQRQSGWGVKLTTAVYLMLRLRLIGAVFYYLCMPSWHGQRQLYTFLYMESNYISFMEHQ